MSGEIISLGTVEVDGSKLDAYVLAPNKVKYFRVNQSVDHDPSPEIVKTYVANWRKK
jgi:hypothetical protein